MRKAEGRQRLVPFREISQCGQRLQEFLPKIPQAVPVKDQVGVVGHVAAGCAEMDDPGRAGRRLAVGVDMGHDVVPDLFFTSLRAVKIDVRNMRGKLIDLLFGYRQAQLMLRPCKFGPELPPGLDALLLRKKLQYPLGGVAAGERRFVDVNHKQTPLVCRDHASSWILCSKRSFLPSAGTDVGYPPPKQAVQKPLSRPVRSRAFSKLRYPSESAPMLFPISLTLW